MVSADLRGQVAAILLSGLLLSQLIAAGLYVGLLPRWQRVERPDSAISRIAMAARVMDITAPEQRPSIARSLSDADFHVGYQPGVRTIAVGDGMSADDELLSRKLAVSLKLPFEQVSVDPATGKDDLDSKRVQIALRGGDSLEIEMAIGLEHRLGLVEQVGLAIFIVCAICGLWAWLTWMVNAPLARVARGAERVGLDIQSPPLAQQGPAQLQRVIRAINDMHRRLQTFLLDRTAMLGAISHELRTPLTRLRLRIDTDRAASEKPKMLDDIEAMEYMLDSTLAYVRGVDDTEPQEMVDLAQLIQTACDTVSDLGDEVKFSPAPPCRYRCRPHALLRALTNVITNAVKHGGAPQVVLTTDDPLAVVIKVEDAGSGISEAEKARVFEPFYRSASTLSANRPGMGLGLPIARSIILSHGGSISLEDRTPTGLRVRITLPRASILQLRTDSDLTSD
jgi:signal transduction histidine kinase